MFNLSKAFPVKISYTGAAADPGQIPLTVLSLVEAAAAANAANAACWSRQPLQRFRSNHLLSDRLAPSYRRNLSSRPFPGPPCLSPPGGRHALQVAVELQE